jgi:NAD(P) transhydrogenase subunit alpha
MTIDLALINQDPFVTSLIIFSLACFVGYFVVWRVTPALHSPLMGVTNAISSVVIVGAMLAAGAEPWGPSNYLGWLGVLFASVNLFGGFFITHRMVFMFKKKPNPSMQEKR